MYFLANSVVLDQTAPLKQSDQEVHCLLVCLQLSHISYILGQFFQFTEIFRLISVNL